jgi:RNA polymerase sigma-70 factor, ECF subfamily
MPLQSKTPNLDLLRAGDNQAWADLYDSLAGDLRAFILRLGARDADDVLGEVMVQLVRDISKYHGDSQGLRPWTYQIARHRVIDAGRKKSRRPVETALLEDMSETYSSASLDAVDVSNLAAVFSQLTTEQREVLWLRYVADMSVAETASVTQKTPEAVTAMSHRALVRLRGLLSSM